MTQRNSDKLLALNGGLGNQFFQLAAALARSEGTVFFDCSSSKIRRNASGLPDIGSFDFDIPIVFIERKTFRLVTSFYINLLFKFSAKTSTSSLLRKFLHTSKIILSGTRYFVADGVGYDSLFTVNSGNRVAIGAFHTFKYFELPRVREILRSGSLKFDRDWLSDLVDLAKEERPIILHVRLGDYENIPELGILDGTYYSEGVRSARLNFPNSRVWLFSDDPSKAITLFGDWLPANTRIIDFDLNDSAGNFEAMRLGSSFIISNSTYSWWASNLAYTEDPLVIAPKRWFNTKQNPSFLLPVNWILL